MKQLNYKTELASYQITFDSTGQNLIQIFVFDIKDSDGIVSSDIVLVEEIGDIGVVPLEDLP